VVFDADCSASGSTAENSDSVCRKGNFTKSIILKNI
jgi:hypothetical protein